MQLMAAKFRSARSNHTVTVGRIQARIVRSADKERAQNQGPVRSVVRGSSPAVGLTGRVPSVVRQKERERERERENSELNLLGGSRSTLGLLQIEF